MLHLDFRKVRETLALWMITLLIGFAVYTVLGLAWTFKTTVEAAAKLRHTLD